MKTRFHFSTFTVFFFVLNSVIAQIGINTNSPTAKLEIKGTSTAASSTGSSDNSILRLSESVNSGSKSIDFGSNGNSYNWIQPRLNSNYASNHPLLLNPNGGNVSIATGANTSTLNVGGSITASGNIRSSASGQILNSVMLNETNLNIASAGVTVANSNTTVVQTNYTPVSTSSKILIEFHCKFDVAGSNSDNWKSYLIVGTNTLQTHEAVWLLADGAGGRGASLFPISAVYSNTTGNSMTIKINVEEISGDDTFKMYSDGIMTITEVAQ